MFELPLCGKILKDLDSNQQRVYDKSPTSTTRLTWVLKSGYGRFKRALPGIIAYVKVAVLNINGKTKYSTMGFFLNVQKLNAKTKPILLFPKGFSK